MRLSPRPPRPAAAGPGRLLGISVHSNDLPAPGPHRDHLHGSLRDLGKAALEQYGYTVLLAADGEEALEVYREERDRIDLIILDLSMPHLSGREVLERLQPMAPSTKIVVSSGHAENGQSRYLSKLGVADFVSKPYDADSLAHSVRKILDTRHSTLR